MHPLDLIIILLVVLSAVHGYRSGTIRTLSALVGVVAGVMFSSANYDRYAKELAPVVHTLALAETIWFVLLILVVMVAAVMVGHQVQAAVNWHGMGLVDHLLGCLIGIVRGGAAAVLCVVIVAAFYPTSPALESSRLVPRLTTATQSSTRMMDGKLRMRVLSGLQPVLNDGDDQTAPD